MQQIQRCLRLQALVTQLVRQHGLDLSEVGQYLRLERAGHLTLIVQVVGPYRLSVGQYYETKEDVLLPFLEILVFTGEAEWVALEYIAFMRRVYATLSTDGAHIFSVCVDQGTVVKTVEQWAEQLVQDGWLEGLDPEEGKVSHANG